MLVWRALTLSGFIFMKKAWQGQYQVSWGGLLGVLADKGTLVKYRKERGNMILFLGNRGTRLYKLEDENMVNTFIKRGTNKENVWEYGSIGQFWKGTRTPLWEPPKSASHFSEVVGGIGQAANTEGILHEWQNNILRPAHRATKILFLARENEINVFKLPCNVLFIT